MTFFIFLSFSGMTNSKLPHVQTSIFSVMSALANEHNAVNLSQGFPNFPCDPELVNLVTKYMKEGKNQYPPMPGIPELREVIAQQTNSRHGSSINPTTEVTVTSGATQAIYTAITATVRAGDEVIILTPAYDCYGPSIELNGAKVVEVPLATPGFKVDMEKLQAAITPRTRMIMVNTPHNPSGSLVTREEWLQIAEMIRDTDILILSDEVYEHIVFDDEKHCSVLAVEELRDRAFVTASFGKTFHVTGWKMGYCIASDKLMAEFRKCHQFIVFTTHTPSQYALAEYMQNEKKIDGLGPLYQSKRDLFLESLGDTAFEFTPAKGTYFQLLNFRNISDELDVDFARKLTIEHKIAAVPISVFYEDRRNEHYLRFCFAKDDDTLRDAGKLLNQISNA